MMSYFVALAAAAASVPTPADVRSAKASIIEAADKAFVKTWNSEAASAEDAPITPSSARAWTKWMMIGTVLGSCRESVPANLQASWLTKIDSIVVGGPVAARMQAEGMKAFENGADLYGELSVSEKSKVCAADVEAARQLLNEPL